MRRIALIASVVAAGVAAFAVSATADDEHTYLIEMYNAFGVVEGSDVRVAGVNAGSVTNLDVNSAKRAVVEVTLSGPLSVLGKDTKCSTQPQSLIAEYFIDCQPDGPEMETSGDPENPDVPASNVEQTVQNDLVANTLREPFKRRLQLLINEFGTALAGNPDNLNEAIRLGAPALTQLEKVLHVLGGQNTILRDLNVDSDHIIARLTQRREDVVRFIQEARDTAAASAERRDDLSTDFALLDDFLEKLNPTLVELQRVAKEGVDCPPAIQIATIPEAQQNCDGLLLDLDASAPGLNTLVQNLPAFNEAGGRSIESLGSASNVGKRALRQGKEEISALAASGQHATSVAEMLADLFRDLDDPGRATEVDARAAHDTNRSAPTGYTGLEGLLNYAYYQSASLNQFDQVGHLLHFSLYYIFTGPCGEFTTGRNPETGDLELPNKAGSTTSTPSLTGSSANQVNNCVGWLGDSQPGLTDPEGSFPTPQPYDDSVCPAGTEPPSAAAELCPGGPKQKGSTGSQQQGGGQPVQTKQGNAGASGLPGAGDSGGPGGEIPGLDLPGGQGLPNDLQDLLDLPPRALNNLPQALQDRLDGLRNQLGGNGGGGGGGGGNHGGGGGGNHGGGGGGGGGGNAVNDLLDYLLGP